MPRGIRRRRLQHRAPRCGRSPQTPVPGALSFAGLSTDNAAMIAAAAFPKLKRHEFSDFTLAARANLTLA